MLPVFDQNVGCLQPNTEQAFRNSFVIWEIVLPWILQGSLLIDSQPHPYSFKGNTVSTVCFLIIYTIICANKRHTSNFGLSTLWEIHNTNLKWEWHWKCGQRNPGRQFQWRTSLWKWPREQPGDWRQDWLFVRLWASLSTEGIHLKE